jgi:hypothetical protein
MYYDLPCRLEPVAETDEKNVMELLAQELNENYMTELATEINVARELGGSDEDEANTSLNGKLSCYAAGVRSGGHES